MADVSLLRSVDTGELVRNIDYDELFEGTRFEGIRESEAGQLETLGAELGESAGRTVGAVVGGYLGGLLVAGVLGDDGESADQGEAEGSDGDAPDGNGGEPTDGSE